MRWSRRDGCADLPIVRLLSLSGPSAVAVLWTTNIVGMRRIGLSVVDREPLSILGTIPSTRPLFVGGLLAAAMLFVVFAFVVHAKMRLPSSFLIVFVLAMAGQVVVALVPIDGAGARHGVHTMAGLVLGGCLPVLMWRFAAGQEAGRWRRAAISLVGLEFVGTVVGIALSRSMRAPLAEVAAAFGFHVWTIVVTAQVWLAAWRAPVMLETGN